MCESESSGTHLSDPPALSAMHSFPRNPADFGHTNQSQELMHGGTDGVGTLGPQRPGTAQGGAAAGGGQPLLRRNQYWV